MKYELFYNYLPKQLYIKMPCYDKKINCICNLDNETKYHVIYKLINYLKLLDNLHLSHTDLNPDNIYLNKLNPIISGHFNKIINCDNNVKYTAPEIIKGKEYSIYNDIWSYGCLIYYIINKIDLFKGNCVKDIINEINNMKNVTCNISEYDNLINSVLKINPYNRLSINEILIYLEGINQKNKPKKLNNIECSLLLYNPHVTYHIYKYLPLRYELMNYIMNSEILLNEIIKYYLCYNGSKYLFFLLSLIWEKNDINFCEKIKNELLTDNCISYCNENGYDKEIIMATCNDYDIQLYGQNIGNEGIEYLSDNLVYIRKIKILDLGRNKIEYDGLKYFSNNIKYISNLETLDISENQLYDISIEYLSNNLKYLPNLKQFGLQSIELSSKGFKRICDNFNYISKLERLNLEDNKINNDGIIYMSNKIELLPFITDISLNNNLITEIGINVILECINVCHKLKRLHLSCILILYYR